jgi:mannosyl-oligosaccharide alpha-1,2-mannosidase
MTQVGGLLSAYELSGKQYPTLVEKAKQVADKLVYAYTGSEGFNFGYVNFTSNLPTRASGNIAEAGTLTLEWATLSKYTGNDTYRQLAESNVKHIIGLVSSLHADGDQISLDAMSVFW